MHFVYKGCQLSDKNCVKRDEKSIAQSTDIDNGG